MHMSMPHRPDFVFWKARKVLEGEQASIEIQMVPVCISIWKLVVKYFIEYSLQKPFYTIMYMNVVYALNILQIILK